MRLYNLTLSFISISTPVDLFCPVSSIDLEQSPWSGLREAINGQTVPSQSRREEEHSYWYSKMISLTWGWREKRGQVSKKLFILLSPWIDENCRSVRAGYTAWSSMLLFMMNFSVKFWLCRCRVHCIIPDQHFVSSLHGKIDLEDLTLGHACCKFSTNCWGGLVFQLSPFFFFFFLKLFFCTFKAKMTTYLIVASTC